MAAQDDVRGDVAVLVPAAGTGTRLGGGVPKALRELGGVSLLVHAVRRVCRAFGVGYVVVAAPAGLVAMVRSQLAPEVPGGVTLDVVAGGETRHESVGAALAATPEVYPIILVHDAARALAPPDLVERVAAAVRAGHPAVVPILPVTDTIKQVDDTCHVVATPDRVALRVVQTPQGFRREVLAAGHRAADGVGPTQAYTDDASLVERIGMRVFGVPGDEAALKVTRPTDLDLAELLLRRQLAGEDGRPASSEARRRSVGRRQVGPGRRGPSR